MNERTERTEQTAVARQEARPDAPAEWKGREEIDALAKRLQRMMPGDLSRAESLALAQYSATMDANPYRGEIYAFESRGRLVIVEGYKLLVRWARRQCGFSERYERMDGEELPQGAIGYRCHVLRDDARETLQTLVEAGAPWDEAMEVAAQSSVGVVTEGDRTSRRGDRIDPPTGWTWEEVARKRALKNALNRAYGAPSPREIARETWMVGETETTIEDWEGTAEMVPEARERLAKMRAQGEDDRLAEEALAEGRDLLHSEQEPLI